jgi:hypothetical protein
MRIAGWRGLQEADESTVTRVGIRACFNAGKAPDAELAARVKKARRGSARFSIVLALTSVAAEPGEARSTTHPAGQDDEALHATMPSFTCQALYPLSAQTSSSQLNRWRILSKTRVAPSRSWMPVGVDDYAQWEAFGINQGVELASLDLLSGVVVTRCVVFTPVLQPLFPLTSATGCR